MNKVASALGAIAGSMVKQAYGAFTDTGEYDRFDPLYYHDDFKEEDPAEMAKMVQHFIDVSKEHKLRRPMLHTEYDDEVKPEQLLQTLQGMATKGETLDPFDNEDIFPAYYSVKYPRSLFGRVKQPKSDVMSQVLKRYLASQANG